MHPPSPLVDPALRIPGWRRRSVLPVRRHSRATADGTRPTAAGTRTTPPEPGLARPLALVSALALGLLSLPLAPGLGAGSTPRAAAASPPACSAFSRTVLERVNGATRASSLTLSGTQSRATWARGFTSVPEPALRAAPGPGRGLVAVHRLYRPSGGGDFFYSHHREEITRAVTELGYSDQGVAFHASPVAGSCLAPVRSYRRSGLHRFTSSAAEGAALTRAGWRSEGVRFHLGRVPTDPRFTIAIMPDTQQEVLRAGDGRMRNRADYLIGNRSRLDLRYVVHTGDVVNWDTPDHAQYARAAAGLTPLRDAGISYSLSIGNHDSAATCAGGSACDAEATRRLFRTTTTFNRYLDPGPRDLAGSYERGRVDNAYRIFTAGGSSWLVLNLELWPRQAVVRWAQQVVAAHPRHNVVVATHSYLTASGSILANRGGYGDTSGRYLFDQLISRYANIRLVFSGHTGTARHRVDRGMHGNRIDSYLLGMHSRTTNPMRFVEIDTARGTLRTWVHAPWTHHTYSGAGYSGSVTGVRWLR